jgi:hypothetical protein
MFILAAQTLPHPSEMDCGSVSFLPHLTHRAAFRLFARLLFI